MRRRRASRHDQTRSTWLRSAGSGNRAIAESCLGATSFAIWAPLQTVAFIRAVSYGPAAGLSPSRRRGASPNTARLIALAGGRCGAESAAEADLVQGGIPHGPGWFRVDWPASSGQAPSTRCPLRFGPICDGDMSEEQADERNVSSNRVEREGSRACRSLN